MQRAEALEMVEEDAPFATSSTATASMIATAR